MTSPRFVDCKCGHGRALHPERTEEACINEGCGCTEYRPVTLAEVRPGAPLPSARTDRQPVPTVEQIIAKGKRSEVKSIASLAERAEQLVQSLQARLDEDSAAATIRAEVAELEQKLAAARMKLRSPKSAAPVADAEPCPDCGKRYPLGQSMSMHRRRSHEGFDPNAQAAS